MDVLIVGYGKIGKIKASIWRSLGRNVCVYDIDQDKVKCAKADGFGVHTEGRRYSDDLTVDISTPALYHLHSLKWLLRHVVPTPKRILIEKPLASTEEEIVAWMELLVAKEHESLNRRIVVNESYYLSTALGYVVDDIAKHGYQVKSIGAELSKNRLPDISRGRFVDKNLGSLGIELPHMIAMVQRLGVSLDELAIDDVWIYRGEGSHNEGFRLNLSAGAVLVVLESYLGDFRLTKNGKVLSNHGITRFLVVETNSKRYAVEFDPVRGLDRYQAKIHVQNNRSSEMNTIVVDDSHLANHLRTINNGYYDESLSYLFAPQNALAISGYILELKKNAQYKDTGSMLSYKPVRTSVV